ncbi:MAG: hypothetical protein AAGC45_08645 [Bacteroidota bacterium]
MRNNERLLNICAAVLFLAGLMDFIRGILHTFQVRYAAENLAQIQPTSDSLVLMGSFGISNFLTAFIYVLIVVKAKKLAPYVLLLVPVSYLLGGYGLLHYQRVLMESPFVGQYMMRYYLGICLVTSLVYFTNRAILFYPKEMGNKKSR